MCYNESLDKRKQENREHYIKELRRNHESGTYYLHSLKQELETLSYEELEDKYMNMVNYLSDASRYEF